MTEQDDLMKAKKEFLERKMTERQREAEQQKHCKSETNTEDLVLQFYRDLQPELAQVESLMTEAETLSERTVGPHLDQIVSAPSASSAGLAA